MNSDIINLLNKCKISFDNEQQLEGMLVPREIFLSEEIYNNIKSDLPSLKNFIVPLE